MAGWQLHDASKAGKYIFPENISIKAKEYLAIFKSSFKFALNNSGDESVALLDPAEREISKVEYKGSKQNVSYNFNGSAWHWSRFLTPGKTNIFNNEPYGTLKIDKNIFINVYADFFVSVGDLDGDKIKVSWDFGDGHKSYLQKTRHKYNTKGFFNGSVKLSDGNEDVVKNFIVDVKSFPHPDVHIISLNANPAGNDSENETIIIENKSKKKLNLKGWSIATGWKKMTNHLIKEDLILKKKQKIEITREIASFTLNNKKAKIELRYPDGKVAYKVKYKKEAGVKEGEVYQKIVGGWGWSSSAKKEIHQSSVIKNVDEDLLVISEQPLVLEDNQAEEEIKNEIPEIKKEPIKIVPQGVIENGIEKIKNQSFVLGAEIVREDGGRYVFTNQNLQHEHYAIVFFKDISVYINSVMNFLFAYFF